MGIFNRRAVAVTALALGLVLSSCASDEEKAGNGGGATETTAADNSGGGDSGGGGGDAAAGKKVFSASCSSCHGPAGEGLPNLGKDMTTSTFIAGLSDSDLVAFIKKGRDTSDKDNTTGVAMPPKGGNPALKDKDLENVVAYIRSIHK